MSAEKWLTVVKKKRDNIDSPRRHGGLLQLSPLILQLTGGSEPTGQRRYRRQKGSGGAGKRCGQLLDAMGDGEQKWQPAVEGKYPLGLPVLA